LVQAAGGTAAVLGGGAAGTAAALVALGGDLYNGVPEVVSSAYNTLTRPGEEFVEGTDTYGAPTRDEHGHVHHVTAGEFVTRTTGDAYTAVHDRVAGLAGPDHQDDAIGTLA